MAVRGKRAIMPKKGGKPTGIFSSSSNSAKESPLGIGDRGKKLSTRSQKQDGYTGPHMGLLKYAKSGGGEDKGKP